MQTKAMQQIAKSSLQQGCQTANGHGNTCVTRRCSEHSVMALCTNTKRFFLHLYVFDCFIKENHLFSFIQSFFCKNSLQQCCKYLTAIDQANLLFRPIVVNPCVFLVLVMIVNLYMHIHHTLQFENSRMYCTTVVRVQFLSSASRSMSVMVGARWILPRSSPCWSTGIVLL